MNGKKIVYDGKLNKVIEVKLTEEEKQEKELLKQEWEKKTIEVDKRTKLLTEIDELKSKAFVTNIEILDMLKKVIGGV